MSVKAKVTMRAAIARFQRHLKAEGERLVKLRRPIDSWANCVIVGVHSNAVLHYGDETNLINWMREAGTLKPYEEIED